MSVWDTVVDVAAVATFLLLCTSIPFYTIFQGFYLTRAPVQRTVTNSLIVNLSFFMESADILLCSFILLPYLLPMAKFMTHHPLVACVEGFLIFFLVWGLSVSTATISAHRLLSTLFYGRYDEWSQSLMLGISLTVVYIYPLLSQLLISVLCHSGGEDPCSFPTKRIITVYNNTEVQKQMFSGMEDGVPLVPTPCRATPTITSFVIMLTVAVIANVSKAIISCCRR